MTDLWQLSTTVSHLTRAEGSRHGSVAVHDRSLFGRQPTLLARRSTGQAAVQLRPCTCDADKPVAGGSWAEFTTASGRAALTGALEATPQR